MGRKSSVIESNEAPRQARARRRQSGELARMLRGEPPSPSFGAAERPSPFDGPTMTNVRVAKSRKRGRTGSHAGPAPAGSGASAAAPPHAMLDPLAPPDTFAPLATERLIL